MLFPIQNITFVVTRALLPNLMGKIENAEGVRKSYFDILFYILSLSAPLMMGLMVLSKNFVDVFWREVLFWMRCYSGLLLRQLYNPHYLYLVLS